MGHLTHSARMGQEGRILHTCLNSFSKPKRAVSCFTPRAFCSCCKCLRGFLSLHSAEVLWPEK